MHLLEPSTPEETAEQLRECASRKQTIRLGGRESKSSMAGPIQAADVMLSTRNLRKVLLYEPRDLTVSVEAGCPFSELQSLLAQNGQMIALDPPFSGEASIGGIAASNCSGPMRRAYGTARDLVIGMKFATLEGKFVQAGGMVVKNVAGLDMAKIMIGSFGTLAAITSLNFRLHSLPAGTETYLYSRPDFEQALEKRSCILKSVLQPVAIDLLSPALALRFGLRGHVLAIRVAGPENLLARYRSEFNGAERLAESEDHTFWSGIQEFTPNFLAEHREGVVARVSTTLGGIGSLPKTVAGAFIARAAAGVSYFYFPGWNAMAPWWRKIEEQGLTAVIEHAPEDIRAKENLWSGPRTAPANEAFVMMEKIKRMFDSNCLLNRKRLYGRI
ncbi:MAG: FAD-binding oxidoreductase [Bryobacteraceae bacterium]